MNCGAQERRRVPAESRRRRMAFDYKKEYKEFYLPPRKPQIIEIPSMNFLAVRGQGDPNEEGGAYKASIGLLYGIAYTIKMSKMGRHKIKGYFDYVVPPLEGFWRQEGTAGIDYSRKKDFQWISLIRLPELVLCQEKVQIKYALLMLSYPAKVSALSSNAA